ncbi:hypothetical protein RRG08_023747 [Elysia crispata]|uniref:D-serine dehydratase-like domain-containing protein n=1 Tax=Elysia crispata TaxID=231223 RepID=A0AAE0ZVH0_9GAST|nr:hypothetical protein RRG08_023747 [Elysia crispata]
MMSFKTLCNIGNVVSKCETPALLVYLDKLEANLKKMEKIMKKYPGVHYRPHAKAHKCPMLGQLQLKHGASGLCCQTLTEAEAMVEGGIEDIFISNEVVGQSKLLRVASLAKSAKISLCVDSEGNIEDLNSAAAKFGVNLDLVVEVNVGQDRAGVEPGEDVVKLAKKVQALPNVNFKGIQCYNGWNQHIRTVTEKKAAVDMVVEKSKRALQILKDNAIDCKYITGGGTGSYVFMDVDYSKNLDESGQPVSDFVQSLFVLGTVQSVMPGNRAVLDAGLKAVSLDSGVPKIYGSGDLTYFNGGDEHGIIRPSGNLMVGDQVWLIPGHCDPTVNMYNWIVGVRDQLVECLWPITGRDCVLIEHSEVERTEYFDVYGNSSPGCTYTLLVTQII